MEKKMLDLIHKHKKVSIPIIIIIFLILSLFIIRLISPKELDDVSPRIYCSQELLEKVDILWIIPKYENKSINTNKSWCEFILSLNKKLGMHGVTHEYEEFATYRDVKYLQKGMDNFEECLIREPTMFKAPQLKMAKENYASTEYFNIETKGKLNQIFHKVYHCNDTGYLPNWFIDLF